MKKIIDFIGDVIVKLIVLVGYVLLPFAYVFGAIIGFVQKLRGVKYKTFTKTFEGLGEMTSISTSEKKCMSWNKHIDLGPWSNVKVIAHRVQVENPDLLAMVSKELRLAEQNIAEIIAAIKEHDVYKEAIKKGIDPLVPNAFVTAELNQGEPGNLDPYVAVFYGSDKYFVWFSIQDGEMTEFTMCNSNETV